MFKTGGTNPFASTSNSSSVFGGQSRPSTNPFGATSTSAPSANPFGGSSSSSAQPSSNPNPFGGMGTSTPEHTVMYLSSGNPHRHAKLSTFPDNIKNGFYFIENKYQNNERYQQATEKALISYAKDDVPELRKQTNEALKSVKTAWNALTNVNLQVKNLQKELEKNQDVVQQMKYMLHEIQNGSPAHHIPSHFFVDLLENFETRLNQYKKRIDEIESVINTNLDQDELQQSSQSGEQRQSSASLLYEVLNLLYQNFCSVSNQVEYVNDMVESRERRIKRYLEHNSSMTNTEIENLFEYRESETDNVIRDLNNLSSKNTEKNTLNAFDKMSLGGGYDDGRNEIGKKRRAAELPLVSYPQADSSYRRREKDEDSYYFRSKRRNDFSPSGFGMTSVTKNF